MEFHAIKFLEGTKKDKVCIITAQTYNELMRDDNSPNFKWYGEVTIENVCEELKHLIWISHNTESSGDAFKVESDDRRF